MMRCKVSSMALAAALVVFTARVAQAVITIETVPVGNIGNLPDDTGYGAVDHAYNIGMYEVTARQYTAFLNAVAKTDTYGLFNLSMWSHALGCKIQRGGTSGDYTYSVASDYANRPVNFVSFWDAARFTNWLHNGQGNGSTETGAYALDGYNGTDGRAITKNAGATWWIPSQDEWYKAAYHKNNGTVGGTANYFDYPTKSDSPPSRNMADPLPGNNANIGGTPYPIDSGKYTTVVGQFQNSASPYGTFDQGGNVWEWNDSVVWSSCRGDRGGSFGYSDSHGSFTAALASSYPGGTYPSDEFNDVGFRVASVPEPASISLLVCGAVGLAAFAWRRRK